MKVLSITFGIPDKEDAMCIRILNVAKILRSNNYNVKFVHYSTSTNGLSDTDKNICKTSIFLLPFNVLKTLLKGDYDLIYGNSQAGTVCAILSKFLLIKKLVFDMHGDTSEEYLILTNSKSRFSFEFLFKRLINFLCLTFSDKIVCVSNSMINYLVSKKGIKREKLMYLPNVVNLDDFNIKNNNLVEMKKKELKVENKIIFGYLGGMQKWQGVDNFIKASSLINNENVLLLVIGGIKYVRKKNLLIIPKVPRSEIAIYYAICDVLVLPRPYNNATEIAAPTKFAEYTAIGKPILLTDVGDASLLVKKFKNGIIIPNNYPDSISKGILNFVSMDDNARIQMGINSRKLSEEVFNINEMKIDFNFTGD